MSQHLKKKIHKQSYCAKYGSAEATDYPYNQDASSFKDSEVKKEHVTEACEDKTTSRETVIAFLKQGFKTELVNPESIYEFFEDNGTVGVKCTVCNDKPVIFLPQKDWLFARNVHTHWEACQKKI